MKYVGVCALLLLMQTFVGANLAVAQNPPQFRCETSASVTDEVRAAYEAHYQCTEKVYEAWFSQYPVEVAQLQNLYLAWQSSRHHDLRGQEAAGQWFRQYPVDFSSQPVELSEAQAGAVGPTQSGEPVQVDSVFERLVVDQDSQRLFLTTKEEGLVSINIAARYAFEAEDEVGESEEGDFLVVDEHTAVLEEKNPRGGNRDLVVLDISNQSAPREVARVRGVLPVVGGANRFHPGMMNSAPTFDQYRSIREGEMSSPSSCVASPAMFKVKPGIHCRPDGNCVERKVVSKPEGMCVPLIAETSAPESLKKAESDTENSALEDQPLEEGGHRATSKNQSAKGQVKSSAVQGDGGSLSQMMVYNKTLYVLSGSRATSHGILTVFDLSDRKNPRIRLIIDLNNGPETLQRHDKLLLIAGRDALVTASLGIETRLRLLGEFRQDCPVSRDPIVMQGAFGYRMSIVEGHRAGCTSRLEVLDLRLPHQPVLRATYPVQQPQGLSVLGDRLFLADAYQGVVVFDIKDPVNLTVVGTWPMVGVKALVLSDFDLFAMSDSEVQTFFVGPLYERGNKAIDAFKKIEGIQTVVRPSKTVAGDEHQ